MVAASAKVVRTLATQPGVRARIRIDVSDEIAGAGSEAGLAGEGEALARLVDYDDARVAKRDFARAVVAGIVDHDDLAGAGGKAAGGWIDLVEDGFETGRKVGLFVVCGNDEA